MKKVTFRTIEDKTVGICELKNGGTDELHFGSNVSGYCKFNQLTYMLKIKFSYYDLGFREKTIVDNLQMVKASDNTKGAYDFLSTEFSLESYSQNECFTIYKNKIIG